jgi:hypothetical protein
MKTGDVLPALDDEIEHAISTHVGDADGKLHLIVNLVSMLTVNRMESYLPSTFSPACYCIRFGKDICWGRTQPKSRIPRLYP